MESNREKSIKKNYSSPKLICYGNIRELTRSGQPSPGLDSPRNPVEAGRSAGGN